MGSREYMVTIFYDKDPPLELWTNTPPEAFVVSRWKRTKHPLPDRSDFFLQSWVQFPEPLLLSDAKKRLVEFAPGENPRVWMQQAPVDRDMCFRYIMRDQE